VHSGVAACFPSRGHFWIASSWVYDLLLAAICKLVGLRAIPFLLIFFRAGLAVIMFLLAGGFSSFFP